MTIKLTPDQFSEEQVALIVGVVQDLMPGATQAIAQMEDLPESGVLEGPEVYATDEEDTHLVFTPNFIFDGEQMAAGVDEIEMFETRAEFDAAEQENISRLQGEGRRVSGGVLINGVKAVDFSKSEPQEEQMARFLTGPHSHE